MLWQSNNYPDRPSFMPKPSWLPGLYTVWAILKYATTLEFKQLFHCLILGIQISGWIRKIAISVFLKDITPLPSQDSNPGPSDPDPEALNTRPWRPPGGWWFIKVKQDSHFQVPFTLNGPYIYILQESILCITRNFFSNLKPLALTLYWYSALNSKLNRITNECI